MIGLFGRNNGCGNESSTILWFVILIILLFMNNDNDCCNSGCGCKNA